LTGGTGSFDALFLDGRSAASRPVRAAVSAGRLRVEGEGIVVHDVPVAEVGVQRSISGDRCTLSLPDGAQLRTTDVAAVEAAFGAAGDSFVRRLEGRWASALLALLFIAAFATWTWRYGLPAAATMIAERTPRLLQDRIGNEALGTLDGTVCNLSTMTPAQQEDMEDATLRRLVKGFPDADHYEMDFRDCRRIGANAFALPSARILVTDDLVKLAGHDPELVATVVAHEIGHVRNRHALRMSLQAMGVGVLIATLAGDAVSITSLAAALPAVLLQTGYSREFEAQADDFALQRLAEVGIAPAKFGDMLERLERAHAKRQGGEDGNDYMSTHPSTAARISKARSFR
jgi:Zn-dependent protease with chaperone function